MNTENISLSIKEAYIAMYIFLENEYELTGSSDIGGLLGGLSLLANGSTADPAAWSDWVDAVRKAVTGNNDISLKIIKD